jgi:hypothetical protein
VRPGSRILNRSPEVQRRGDGNGDGELSAADFTALIRELSDGDGTSADDARRGAFAGSAWADANGDGQIERLDVSAQTLRLVPR